MNSGMQKSHFCSVSAEFKSVADTKCKEIVTYKEKTVIPLYQHKKYVLKLGKGKYFWHEIHEGKCQTIV